MPTPPKPPKPSPGWESDGPGLAPNLRRSRVGGPGGEGREAEWSGQTLKGGDVGGQALEWAAWEVRR
ncbi:hypothetical protein H4W80_000064 [Nonomuraea angiospora]|uniref:Uncharacterized protein n=1 Tax=Nonomuraea angiospora TaxID=46172 RepID=A0ABR9LMC3_9ACTN|nr:hypothetical protein [Nonomuraea angiospora]